MEKQNLKELLHSIKEKFETDNDSFEFFETFSSKKELGIVSIDTRNKKFDLRGENTPSVKAYPKLVYVDYGGEGKPRDVIQLILENNPEMKFPDAVKLLASWLNEDTSKFITKGKSENVSTEKALPYSQRYITSQIEERNIPENKDIFMSILKGLFRSCSIEEMRVGVKAFNIGLNKYEIELEDKSKIQQWRLFIPEYDEKLIPYGSYRYNREYKDNKGLLRRNCKRVLFGSHLLKYFKKSIPIVVSEGHSDVCVNIAKYMQSVTTGSSTSKITPFLPLLKGFELHFYPDSDQPGIKGVTLKILEIEEFNYSLPEEDKIKYKIFSWGKGFVEKDIQDFKNLYIPFEEILINDTLKKYSKKWWLNHFNEETLTEFIDFSIIRKEQELIISKKIKEDKKDYIIPDSIWIDNWKPVSKDFVQQGFDFIDFHTKFQSSEKYEGFISKYKFK